MKYHISKPKKSAIAIEREISKAAPVDSPVFDPENRNQHDPENRKILEFMEEYGPRPFNLKAEMFLLLHPKHIERYGQLPNYLLLVDKARGSKRDGHDAFARREESDKAEKRRERRERWTLRIAFLALIAAAFEESITIIVMKYLLGQ